MISKAQSLESQRGGYRPPGTYAAPPATTPPSSVPGHGHGPSGYGGPPHHGEAAELRSQAMSWLIISALSFVLCAGVNCFGLIAALLCFLAMQAADQGNLLDAESKLKWGKIISVTGGVLALLSLGLMALYYLVARASL